MSPSEGKSFRTKFNFMRVIPKKSDFHVKIDDKRIFEKCTRRILFEGDRVFYRDSQCDVTHVLLKGVVEEFFKGCNSLILAYGGPGCGKSFTCFGTSDDFEDRGLAIILLEKIFRIKTSLLHKAEVSLELSFIEFKKNSASDLLTNKTIVLTQHKMTKINSIYAAMQLLFAGCVNRYTRRIKNYNSHYYTAVLTIRMHYKSLTIRDPVVKRCQIQIVDLASVEHQNSHFEKPISTLQSIGNISIMHILRMVDNLNKSNKFYCISPLISHLSETLGVNSLVKFIGHSEENLPMLRQISKISKKFSRIPQSTLKYGVEQERNLRIQVLKEQLKSLTKQCRQNDMVREQEAEVNTAYEREEQIKRLNIEFLENHISDYGVLSVAQIRVALTMLKTIIKQFENENSSLNASINVAQMNERIALDILAAKNDKLQSKSSQKSSSQQEQISQPIILVGQEMSGCGITVGGGEGQTRAETFWKTTSAKNKFAKKVNKSRSDALSNTRYSSDQKTIKALIKKANSDCLDIFSNLKQSQSELGELRKSITTTQDIILGTETWKNEFIQKIKMHEFNKCNEDTNSLNLNVIHQNQYKNLNFNEKINVRNEPVEESSKSYVKVYKAPSIKNVDVFKIKDEFKDQYSLFQKVYLNGRRK